MKRKNIWEILKKVIDSTIKTRKEYNKKLLLLLEEEIDKNPEIRFIQLLYNTGIIGEKQDRFYEESKLTYHKVKRRLEKDLTEGK